MDKLLTVLANGTLSAASHTTGKSKAIRGKLDTIRELENSLNQTLNKAEQDLLNKLEKAQIDLEDLLTTDRFICGFKLGALMMLEILEGRDSLTAEEPGE